VKNQAKVVVTLPTGQPHTQTTGNTAPVTLEGTLVGSDRFEGKLRGGVGSETLSFSATRRGG
jgi:hypothetical protein